MLFRGSHTSNLSGEHLLWFNRLVHSQGVLPSAATQQFVTISVATLCWSHHTMLVTVSPKTLHFVTTSSATQQSVTISMETLRLPQSFQNTEFGNNQHGNTTFSPKTPHCVTITGATQQLVTTNKETLHLTQSVQKHYTLYQTVVQHNSW